MRVLPQEISENRSRALPKAGEYCLQFTVGQWSRLRRGAKAHYSLARNSAILTKEKSQRAKEAVSLRW
jgi:hypothetical protein